eukprot:TRINITY_DN7132_c0_g2_i1.p1 TRINITY_DN7132_c0_g2~~TRINITY_DN7132_c0_g2_i1.p1  ORF type:complete len:266 (-),score=58.55 TRINITY_DN7132_c0_g2_i1:98-895(-)
MGYLTFGEAVFLGSFGVVFLAPQNLPVIARMIGKYAGASVNFMRQGQAFVDTVYKQYELQQISAEVQKNVDELYEIRRELKQGIRLVNPPSVVSSSNTTPAPSHSSQPFVASSSATDASPATSYSPNETVTDHSRGIEKIGQVHGHSHHFHSNALHRVSHHTFDQPLGPDSHGALHPNTLTLQSTSTTHNPTNESQRASSTSQSSESPAVRTRVVVQQNPKPFQIHSETMPSGADILSKFLGKKWEANETPAYTDSNKPSNGNTR